MGILHVEKTEMEQPLKLQVRTQENNGVGTSSEAENSSKVEFFFSRCPTELFKLKHAVWLRRGGRANFIEQTITSSQEKSKEQRRQSGQTNKRAITLISLSANHIITIRERVQLCGLD